MTSRTRAMRAAEQGNDVTSGSSDGRTRDGKERRWRKTAETALAERDAAREALEEIARLVKTRSTGVRMDGTTEWPTLLHGQVYDIARAALAPFRETPE